MSETPTDPRTSLAEVVTTLHGLRVREADPSAPIGRNWTLQALAHRLTEVSASRASACLSPVFTLVLEAQRCGENVVWVSGSSSIFFPPDVAELGVDLDALAVVRVPRSDDLAVAADWTARSGAFALIVLDLISAGCNRLPISAQSRLLSLAQKHAVAILCLTETPSTRSSLSSLVSLRVEPSLHRRACDTFDCSLRVLKDKQRSATWNYVETRCGTPGLH